MLKVLKYPGRSHEVIKMPQVRNNRNFGWHAGTVTAWDMILNNDFYIYGDLHFGDVSVDVFTITGYMLVSGSPAIGIDMSGTFSTVAINIDGTCNGTSASAINIDLDYDFATIGAEYPAAIYLDLTQTSKFTTGYGGFYGIASRVRAAYANVGTYGILGKAYVTATGATQLINDVYGLMGELLINGTDTQRFATTSSLAAIRGSVSNSSTGAWNGQVFALMLDFGPHENYGDTTALIYAYTHGDAHCDYGFVINNYSTNMTTGIWITETAGSTPAIATGIDIDANCTIAAIAAKVAATAGGITVDAGTINHAVDGSIISVDLDVEGAYSVNAFNTTIDFETTGMGAADVTAGFKADINELLVHTDGAGLYGTDVTLTGFDTGRCDIVGHLVTLDGSKTAGDTSAGFKVVSTQTINHSGEDLYGLWVDFSGITHTDGNIYGQYLDMSFVNGSAAYGLYVAMGGGGSDAGVSINGISETGLIINSVNSIAAIDITGAWGVSADFSAAGILIDVDFGSVANMLAVERVDITAQVGVAEKYVMGKYLTLATSGAGAGTVLQHGIWIGDYAKITVAHNTTDAYAQRGRTVISGAIAGNQFIGVMGQFEVSAAATLEATGGGYGIYGSIVTSGSATVNRNVAAGYFTLRPNTVDLAGIQSCVVADMGGSGYADYGVLAQCGNNNLGEAMIGILSSDSAVVPVGIKFGQKDASGSITNAFEFLDGTAPHSALKTGNSASDSSIVIDVGGSTKYIPVFDSAT